jgi:hypothetical protein
MHKKYIIVAVIAILVWGGFMVYRHQKKQKDSSSYRNMTQNQMEEIARKSPRGSMVLIGRALGRYYKENKRYPSKLSDIYPKYLANKSLLDKTDFNYEPKGDDFYLSTTFNVDQRRILAYMEKDLRPRVDTGVMIAAPTPVQKPKAVQSSSGLKKVELSTETKLAMARENLLNALRRGAFNVASVSLPDTKEERLIAAAMPQIISESEGAGPEVDLGQRYLVWKGETGVLGFSNVQYPESDRLFVYVYGRWFDVKMPSRQGEKWHVSETQQSDLDTIAAKLNEKYLVWKDDRGTVGFGNVQYPERHLSAVFETDAWVEMERKPFGSKAVSAEEGGSTRKKSLETIASEFGNQYLVWKDEQGTLGFGNGQYPQGGIVYVYQTTQWVDMANPLLVEEKGAHGFQDMPAIKSPEEIASTFSSGFLVWKEKNGTLGFGNVQYPGKDLDSVYDFDGWAEAKQPPSIEKGRGTQKAERPRTRFPEDLAAAFSTRYLVWKDKGGVLGFGNVQYPETETISGVHVNGSWESVAN